MFVKTIVFSCGCILFITMLTIPSVVGDIEDNEVMLELGIPEYYMMQGVRVYRADRQCRLVGGLCVHRSDCNEPTTTKNLCPSNAYRNVECCYELPMKPAPCEEHLGNCVSHCPKNLMRPGTDCTNGKVCCVLVV